MKEEHYVCLYEQEENVVKWILCCTKQTNTIYFNYLHFSTLPLWTTYFGPLSIMMEAWIATGVFSILYNLEWKYEWNIQWATCTNIEYSSTQNNVVNVNVNKLNNLIIAVQGNLTESKEMFQQIERISNYSRCFWGELTKMDRAIASRVLKIKKKKIIIPAYSVLLT